VLNENAGAIEESETIFVGNLPWSATKDEITELFSDFGQVVNVRIRELSTN
jgi:RNA recognition motif-containing protein